MTGKTAEEALIRHHRQDGEYSDINEYVLHSFPEGFEVVELKNVSGQELEDWRSSEDHIVEKVSPRDLSQALGTVVGSRMKGGGFIDG